MGQLESMYKNLKEQPSNTNEGILKSNQSQANKTFFEDESISQNVTEYLEAKNLTRTQNGGGTHRIEGASEKGKSSIAENVPVKLIRDEIAKSLNNDHNYNNDRHTIFSDVSNDISSQTCIPELKDKRIVISQDDDVDAVDQKSSNLRNKNDLKPGNESRIKKDKTKHILHDSVNGFKDNFNQDSNKKDVKDRENNHKSASKLHENDTSVEEVSRGTSEQNDIIYDIKTFEDSLKYFGLTELLQELETSLEDLKRNKKSITDHEDCFRKIDKKILKLSLNFHPDSVQRNGGSEKELLVAQKLQTALNATRTMIKCLNSAFTEDIGFCHKFGFYMQLKITSMNNEDEIKEHVYKFILQFGVISQIKQDITSEIRKFLIKSCNYVHGYLNNKDGFEKYRDMALFHLECCINGFEKLCVELEKIKSQCAEENGENMHSFIQTMIRNSKKNSKQLKLLQIDAKASLKGKYVFFSPEEDMDPYFVLPLVSYTNVMLMCNAVMRGKPRFSFLNSHSNCHPRYKDDLEYLMQPYYLASYFCGNAYYEKLVREIMDNLNFISKSSKLQLNNEDIESAFRMSIQQINEIMESKFKTDDYNEVNTTNILIADLEKCLAMMKEFNTLEREVSEYLNGFQNHIVKLDDMNDKINELKMETEETRRRVKEILEQSGIK